MRRKEERKWVLQFKRKHPSAVMEEGGRGLRMEAGDGCSVHGKNKTKKKQQKPKSKQQAGGQGETSTGQTLAAHKTGGGTEGPGGGRRDIYRTEKREMLTLESRL